MPNIPTAQNNPGDIKQGGQIATFSSPQEGKAALYNDLTAKMNGTSSTGVGPSSTLVDFAKVYAPAADKNNPLDYAAKLANQLQVSPDTQIGTLHSRIDDFANAISNNEGYRPTEMPSVPAPTPSTETPSPVPTNEGPSLIPDLPSIGNELASNLSGRLKTLSSAATTGSQGGPHIVSGLLQGAGAIAGGAGDVLNAGLQLIPGVQALEKGIGNALGSLANTPQGQQIVQAGTAFAQAHPEIAGDIGAAVNVASLFPLLRGLSLAKGAATDAAVNAFKGKLEGAAENELRTVLPTKAATSLATAEKRGLSPMKFLTSDGKNLPDVVERPGGGFEYSTEGGMQNIQESLAADENQLQQTLAQGIKKNVPVDLGKVREQLLKDVGDQYPLSGVYAPATKAVNDFMDSVEASSKGRKVIDLNELNTLKRNASKAVNFDNLGAQKSNIMFTVRQSLMDQISNLAKENGITGIEDINKTMGTKLEAMKILKSLNGKGVKAGGKARIAKEVAADVAGGGAELLGNAAGIPFASTLAGRGVSRLILNKIPTTATGMLSRAAKRPLGASATQGLLKSAQGVAQQALVRPKNQR